MVLRSQSLLKKDNSSPILAFDIDGVVTDTMEAFLSIASQEYGYHLKKEDITSYWLDKCLDIPTSVVDAIVHRILNDPYGVGLSPIEGAFEALRRFSLCSPLIFVTARPLAGPIEGWLQAGLSISNGASMKVIATGKHGAKLEVLKAMGIKFFVEDHLDTCRQLCEHGINAIVFDQPWNQGGTPYKRVGSWMELRQIFSI